MRTSALFPLLCVPILAVTACGEQEAAQTTAEPEITCDLSLDQLTDSEWLFLREINGQEPIPDPKSRLKFVQKDGNLVAKYTAASLSDMYDYSCTKNEDGDQLICRTDAELVKWCQTLMANNRKCNLGTLQQLDPTIKDSEELTKAVEEATKLHEEVKKTDGFQNYKSQFNSLANKLQGLVYVNIDKNQCRLQIIDNYMAYTNKKRMEDSNPNGSNAFVKNTLGNLQWADCDTPQLFDTLSKDFPEKPEEVQPIGRHAVGTEVHYWVLHEPLRYAEEGCEYTYDVFHNYKQVQSGLKPEIVEVKGKKENRFHYSQKFDAPSKRGQPEVVMTTHQIKCADKPEKIITTCNKVGIMK